MTIGVGHYLSVAAILFTLGIFGIFMNRKNVHRQSIPAQNARSKKTAIEVRKVQPGQGI
jgi:hypothetical protein